MIYLSTYLYLSLSLYIYIYVYIYIYIYVYIYIYTHTYVYNIHIHLLVRPPHKADVSPLVSFSALNWVVLHELGYSRRAIVAMETWKGRGQTGPAMEQKDKRWNAFEGRKQTKQAMKEVSPDQSACARMRCSLHNLWRARASYIRQS